MHISTFYSYKGGVGRTFALVNVAAELAKSGRKVLVVDFDLEAPGIDTFQGFENKNEAGGIVQFVTDYIERKVPPPIENYVYEASVSWHEKDEVEANGEKVQFSLPEELAGRIWVMPAGKRSSEYDLLLSGMNWQRLYDEYEGFLFFEDLKQQWETKLSPDYVLIDSRTGHTDVGGICTRQLADLVVILFTPNEQNLKGLSPIVRAIRNESKSNQEHKIELCFVASNVPTLDDEEGILRQLMARFRRAFQDAQQKHRILTVQRYDSLQLLNQDIFTLVRPNSRLARQYRVISQFIVEQNIDDRQGVLEYLKNPTRFNKLTGLEHRLSLRWIEQILVRYQDDPEVLLWIASHYRQRSEPAEAIKLLEKAQSFIAPDKVDLQNHLRLELAEACFTNQQMDKAAKQLELLVCENTLEPSKIAQLLRLWKLTDKPPTSDLAKLLYRSDMGFQSIKLLAEDMTESAEWQKFAVDLLLRNGFEAIDRDPDALNMLLLSLLGARRFDLLPEVIAKLNALEQIGLPSLFNIAMANWALNKRPDLQAFQALIEVVNAESRRESANYSQCVSLAQAVLGYKLAAIEYLNLAYKQNKAIPISKFSCWRYISVNQTKFESDLDELQSFINSGDPLPRFMRAQEEAD